MPMRDSSIRNALAAMAQTRRSNSEASRRCIVSPLWNHRRPAIGAEIGTLWPACLYLICSYARVVVLKDTSTDSLYTYNWI
jgi:hypothetical protein